MENPSFLNLFFDLHQLIFEYLNLDEVVKMRLVCKSFKNLITEEFRVRELIFYDNQTKGNWYYINKPWNIRSQIGEKQLDILMNPPFNIKCLKSLKISRVKKKFNMEAINKLSQLNHLEIGFYDYNKKNQYFKIDLPNLKVLSLASYGKSRIEVNTPKLEILFLNQQSLHSTKFSTSSIIKNVKYLTIHRYEEKVSMFENLEHLEILDAREIDLNILKKFRNLKVINIMESKILNLNILNQQRLKLKRHDLKLYFNNVEIFKNDKLDLKDVCLLGCTLESIIINFNKLSDCVNWYTNCEYSVLIRLMNNSIPKEFLKEKIINIKRIETNDKIDNQKKFSDFIMNCLNLEELEIEDSELNQNFYDQLPSISCLNKLKINEKKQIGLNFLFISRMFNLRVLKTNQELIDQDLTRLKTAQTVKYVDFYLNGNHVHFEFTRKKNECYFFTNLTNGQSRFLNSSFFSICNL